MASGHDNQSLSTRFEKRCEVISAAKPLDLESENEGACAKGKGSGRNISLAACCGRCSLPLSLDRFLAA